MMGAHHAPSWSMLYRGSYQAAKDADDDGSVNETRRALVGGSPQCDGSLGGLDAGFLL